MSAIADIFKNKKAFVAYLTAGDGGFDKSLAVMRAYAESGVDIIEVGVPFSDPVADGPVIQAAAMRSIDAGFTLGDVLKLIKVFKQDYSTPIILFGYLNPILQTGLFEDFFVKAKSCGVDGSLIVDLPLEEGAQYHQACVKAGVDPIYLIAPSTPDERLPKIAKLAQGMLYYACRKGVTGVRDGLPAELSERINKIKSVTKVPVVVGFGVADNKMAQAILAVADGFVVGSLLVDVAANLSDQQLRDVITGLVSSS
jgi:tryptophan synthase alpha chain